MIGNRAARWIRRPPPIEKPPNSRLIVEASTCHGTLCRQLKWLASNGVRLDRPAAIAASDTSGYLKMPLTHELAELLRRPNGIPLLSPRSTITPGPLAGTRPTLTRRKGAHSTFCSCSIARLKAPAARNRRNSFRPAQSAPVRMSVAFRRCRCMRTAPLAGSQFFDRIVALNKYGLSNSVLSPAPFPFTGCNRAESGFLHFHASAATSP